MAAKDDFQRSIVQIKLTQWQVVVLVYSSKTIYLYICWQKSPG